jgi:hypothetical protein
MLRRPLPGILLLLHCSADPPSAARPTPAPTTHEVPHVRVQVLLDGAPQAGVRVAEGGDGTAVLTDEQGEAEVPIDSRSSGERVIHASHPEARIGAALVPADLSAAVKILLRRFAQTDNDDYIYQDPGAPGVPDDSSRCGHCHHNIMVQWHASPHRTSASNPVVQDLFAGAASFDEPACAEQSGRWLEGIEPGTGVARHRCYLGTGALPALNTGCGED